MKILHITHTHVSTDSRIIKEISALAENGYDVTAIGSDVDKSRNSINEISGIKILEISTWSRKLNLKPKLIKHTLSVIELLFRMVPLGIKIKPNIIHVHDTVVLPAGVIIKMITGAKIIYDAHELESDRNGLGKFTKNVVRNFEKLVWDYIDGLIVVSPSIENWYNKNIGCKKTEVIYNSPVLKSEKIINNRYFIDCYSIPENCKIFIYVGILEKGRGIDIITEAFTRSSIESHVVFMGYGSYYANLENLSAKFKNIHVHPAVPHSEVVRVIGAANFGLCIVENVSLSDYYCLPNKLFEYYFANVPVLASNFPDIDSFIEKNKCGVTCNVEIESVVKCILEIQNNLKNFDFLNQKEYDWNSQKEKLISFYNENFSNSEG
jgi:glycosyltransferase involved in cell wall biosynthesis